MKSIIFGLGGIQVLRYCSSVIGGVWRLIRPTKNLLLRYGEGSWALVTGGSDGIGKAYCEELSKLGFNIILVGRDRVKCENVRKSILE